MPAQAAQEPRGGLRKPPYRIPLMTHHRSPKFPTRLQVRCTMEKEVRRLKKINLALTVAEGDSIAEWARQNGVPERTAQRWAQDRNVRREVDACRRRALNEAIGRLTGMATNAVDGIANLAKAADSESVQLRAWRGVLADLMSVSKFSVLEYRITEIEEELDKRAGHTHPAR